MATLSSFDPLYIGNVGTTRVYEINLSSLGDSFTNYVTLEDKNSLAGENGAASGLDLDFFFLSYGQSTLNSVSLLFPPFTQSIVFQHGTMRPTLPDEPDAYKQSHLLGADVRNLNVVDPNTLGAIDGNALSLGDGGKITFFTNLFTADKYLYYGDNGPTDDRGGIVVSVSNPGQTINGTSEGEEFNTSNSDDAIFGANGNDTVRGAFGDDRVYGGNGDDLIYGNQGIDIAEGGDGNDTIFGGQGEGPAGPDGYLRYGIDILYGNTGSDVIYGNWSPDIMYGNQGADTMYGGQDKDTIF